MKSKFILFLVACTSMFLGCVGKLNAEFKVHCEGEGLPVYLIGGGPAFTTWNLQPIQEELAKRYQVCRWDMRGVGENAGLTFNSESKVLSQWLEDMQTVLPAEPVTLWGHSWGALQAMLFAKEHPTRVRNLILSNPVDPGLYSLERIELKRFNHPDIESHITLDDIGTPVEARHNLRSKIASYFADSEKGWAYAAGFTEQDTNSYLNIQIWADYRARPLSDSDVKQLANKITGVIYCDKDVLQPESLREYQRLLETSRHYVLNSCAHFPWEENPQAYFDVLFSLVGNE